MPSITVALAGNPNSGKTTLFNRLTGARQRVGNYPGVTVEWKEGVRKTPDADLHFVDLPGTYSLTAYSEEELVARDYLLSGRPDVVVDVVDASNLERNLYLTTELLELGLPLVVVLNMSDVAEHEGPAHRHRPALPPPRLPGGRGRSAAAATAWTTCWPPVLDAASRNGDGRRPGGLRRPDRDPPGVRGGRALGDLDEPPPAAPQRRWYALKLIERDEKVLEQLGRSLIAGPAAAAASDLDLEGEDTSDIIVSRQRYEFINQLCRTAVKGRAAAGGDRTDRIDRWALHPVWGVPIFLALMFGAFHLTFTLGAPLMTLMETGIGWLATGIGELLARG